MLETLFRLLFEYRPVMKLMTWGTLAGYADPVVWLDAFYAAYRSSHGNRDPRIDYLAFHWYDYGLDDQLDRLLKYGKPFWVTEFANWHSQADGAQVDSIAKQKAQMTAMVATCERRTDVFRQRAVARELQRARDHGARIGQAGSSQKHADNGTENSQLGDSGFSQYQILAQE